MALVGGPERLAPLRAVGGHLLERHAAADAVHGVHEVARPLAAVEPVGALGGEPAQAGRHLRPLPDLADARDEAVGLEEGLAARRVDAQAGERGVGHLAEEERVHREALLGHADGRREVVGPLHRAEPVGHRLQAGDRAGDADAQPGGLGHVRRAGERPPNRRAVRVLELRVQVVGLVRLRVVDEGAEAAGGRGHLRLDHVLVEHGRDRGVDGVATLAQHVERGLRHRRVRRRDHGVRAVRDRLHALLGLLSGQAGDGRRHSDQDREDATDGGGT